MQSLPENSPSEALAITKVWERLEKIARDKGLTQLSHFVIEDLDVYKDALEALDELDIADALGELPPAYELDRAELENDRRCLRAKLHELEGQADWFSAVDAGIAIKTMHELIQYLKENPDVFAHSRVQNSDELLAHVIQDLHDFSTFLGKVESRHIRFRFWIS
ncbi:hypothetical protein ON05_007185 [Acaryochloris sp. CCMEE 5410]|nr:hypothetical protein ON05_007185 [Acaryochloris sp. CCMEE 5410]